MPRQQSITGIKVVEDNLIKQLMTSLKCGVCGQNYGLDGITVLGHEQDLWFLKVVCPACHAQCLVAVVAKEDKPPEVITELTPTEIDRFKDSGRVTTDDLLDMHNFLKGFDGDLSHLLSQK